MNIRVRLFAVALALAACEPQISDDPIPWVSFPEVVINLSLPEYVSLRSDGGYKEINSAGVRGIIVYRVSQNMYRAYERNCTFSPNEAGATINVHSSGLYMTDYSCGSTFSFEQGTPTGGPAWRPLRQYRVSVANNELTITDEAIN